jgi:hypothetical protein
MANAWTKLVQEKFRLGRLSNPSFSLGEAMKSAKKVYKKGVELSADVVSRKTRGRKSRRKHSKTRGGRR